MPNNWKTYKLEDIASFSYGKMPKKSLIGKGDYPTFSGYKYQHQYPEFNVSKGDLIVVARGVGGTGDVKLVKEESYLTNLSIKIDLNQKILTNKYFYYKFLINNLKYLDSGSAQSQLTINDLSKIDITFPPLIEQKAIANILSAIDDKIENNLATNKTLEDMAMALYKHWFVDFGPFQDGEFIDSELGLIPKGWEVKRLEELGRMYYGKMPKKDKIQTTGFPLYSGYRLVGHYPEFNCKKGKVIVLARGVGGTGDIKMTKTDLFLTNISICIKNELEIISDLILFYILKSTGLHYLRTGSAQPQITINDLNSVQLIIPSKEIQNEFLESFKSLIDKKEENIIENENLSKLRDTLLPKLISGEVRLKEFREQVENVITNAVK